MVNPKKKPKFKKEGSGYLKRVKDSWRKPRGRDSKLRVKEKGKGALPSVGYRGPKELRDLHPSGYEEVLVRNLNDLKKIDKEKEAGRISSKIGKRKKEVILKKAEELGIEILNP